MSGESDRDRTLMKRALRLAARARGMTSPNPMVGALIVKHGRVIAEDYHRRAGEPHAEALVIATAGAAAEGSTLYVTLEPCCHLDKRTPPCTRAIVNAGIRTVVVAMRDPNPKVSGKGIRELRGKGVEIVEGVLEGDALRLNEAYVKHVTTGLPFVILKTAMTLDGKIATPEGQSKWITGPRARQTVHTVRGSVDAIMTAIGTVKADNPELTVRLEKGTGRKTRSVRSPLRVIIDPELETPSDYRVLQVPPPTLVVTRRVSDSGRHLEARGRALRMLLDSGVEVIEHEGERVDLKWLMTRLGERGVTSLMIEGGSSLNASALREGIVDKVMFFVAPKIIGGRDSVPVVGGRVFGRLEDALVLKDVTVKKMGEDLLIEGYIASAQSR